MVPGLLRLTTCSAGGDSPHVAPIAPLCGRASLPQWRVLGWRVSDTLRSTLWPLCDDESSGLGWAISHHARRPLAGRGCGEGGQRASVRVADAGGLAGAPVSGAYTRHLRRVPIEL